MPTGLRGNEVQVNGRWASENGNEVSKELM